MTELIQETLESTLFELNDLAQLKLFTEEELKMVVEKRREFEYQLRRTIVRKLDFLKYLEFEMNFDLLRRTRKQIRGLKRTRKSTSEFASTKRIGILFEKAIRRWPTDIRLWYQYLSFCEKRRRKKLSSIYARALEINARNTHLWIRAASWEFENNLNIRSARRLMQRAIRTNPNDKLLWVEYFRLEILYLQKVVARRKFLGIEKYEKEKQKEKEKEEKEEKEKEKEKEEEDQDKANEDDQEKEKEKEKKKEKEKEEKEKEELHRKNLKKYLDYSVPMIIYNNATKSISDDLEFRLKFINILKEYPETTKSLNKIYSSLINDFPKNEKSWEIYCEKEFALTPKITINNLTEIVNSIENKYKEALKKVNTCLMWRKYTSFYVKIIQILDPIDNAKSIQIYKKKILNLYNRGLKKVNVISESYILEYLKMLISFGQLAKSIQICEKVFNKYNDSNNQKKLKKTINDSDNDDNDVDEQEDKQIIEINSSFCNIYFSLFIRNKINLLQKNKELFYKKISEFVSKLIQSLNASNGKEVEEMKYIIWKNYLKFLICEQFDMDMIVETFWKCIKSFSTFFDRRKIEMIKIMVIKWCYLSQGSEIARKEILKLINFAGISLNFLQNCVNFERMQIKDQSTIIFLRKLFEYGIDRFGKNSDIIWNNYIEFENENEEFKRSSQLYWKAMKTLNKNHILKFVEKNGKQINK
ncbi:u3 small nucleolar RNA-associated protein 6 [Anaeramoeba flamelloides]|uniref:U3 small nucleolar RNA-associated protein 6 n=1 Tax=Anaeramoeba flamelloides TaxID=1746091 RepID=A0AAV7Z814_9EUKA|nr:u3 small nucleolar RNA-associated protein 6 [Anaeramoeba flamelloides]